ncbi:MAG: hypothetical protein AAGE65_09855, partial [Planctomycetota bacterium]
GDPGWWGWKLVPFIYGIDAPDLDATDAEMQDFQDQVPLNSVFDCPERDNENRQAPAESYQQQYFLSYLLPFPVPATDYVGVSAEGTAVVVGSNAQALANTFTINLGRAQQQVLYFDAAIGWQGTSPWWGGANFWGNGLSNQQGTDNGNGVRLRHGGNTSANFVMAGGNAASINFGSDMDFAKFQDWDWEGEGAQWFDDPDYRK